jgi:hypothetical protein
LQCSDSPTIQFWPSGQQTIEINSCRSGGKHFVGTSCDTFFCALRLSGASQHPQLLKSMAFEMRERGFYLWIFCSAFSPLFEHFNHKKKVKEKFTSNRFCFAINLSSFIIACGEAEAENDRESSKFMWRADWRRCDGPMWAMMP